jgi:hypothetical protein
MQRERMVQPIARCLIRCRVLRKKADTTNNTRVFVYRNVVKPHVLPLRYLWLLIPWLIFAYANFLSFFSYIPGTSMVWLGPSNPRRPGLLGLLPKIRPDSGARQTSCPKMRCGKRFQMLCFLSRPTADARGAHIGESPSRRLVQP